jgi:type II secretory pathway component PulF
MPTFVYTARSLDGRSVEGELNAPSRRDAMSMLAQKSLFPLRMEDQKARPSWQDQLAGWRSGRVKTEHLSNGLSQLADLLQNGVPLLSALKLLSEQTPDATLRDVFASLHAAVSEGVALDVAVSRHPKVFSDLTVSMIRAGSEGAFLEEALTRVAGFLELEEELKGRVKGAMAYPLFLAFMGMVVTLVLVVFFVPKFEGLFQRLERQGNGLPAATVILLAASHFLLSYGWLVLIGIVPAIMGILRWLSSDRGRTLMDRVKLRLPLAGKIFHETAVSRFCRVLGTLLRNGVPILKALQISSGSVGNRLLARAILDSAEHISAGQTLSAPLAQCGLIPPATMAMIRIAEESNNLDTVLVGIADTIDRRIEKQLTMMVRFVEPIMLVLIGVAIMFVLVALLLPVFEMSTSV